MNNYDIDTFPWEDMETTVKEFFEDIEQKDIDKLSYYIEYPEEEWNTEDEIEEFYDNFDIYHYFRFVWSPN